MKFSLTGAGAVISAVAVVGISWSAFSVGLDAMRTRASLHWPEVDATVTKVASTFPQKISEDGQIVEFRYLVNGTWFTGNRINFYRRSVWPLDEAKRLAETFISKKEIKIHYDPSNPTVSVIFPGGSNLPNLLFLSVQIAVAFGFSWLLLLYTRSKKAEQGAAANP